METVGSCKVVELDQGQTREDEEQQRLLAGYRAMAADHEREDAAYEWSEALIGDSSEAR